MLTGQFVDRLPKEAQDAHNEWARLEDAVAAAESQMHKLRLALPLLAKEIETLKKDRIEAWKKYGDIMGYTSAPFFTGGRSTTESLDNRR